MKQSFSLAVFQSNRRLMIRRHEESVSGDCVEEQERRERKLPTARRGWANKPVLVTAARMRMLLNLKSLVWAAARDGGR